MPNRPFGTWYDPTGAPMSARVRAWFDGRFATKAELSEVASGQPLDLSDATVASVLTDPGTATGAAHASKADAADVDEALAGKADTATVDAALADKANTAAVDAALAEKADADATATALAGKADAGAVDAALESKADVSVVANKADTVVVNAALAEKADKSGLPVNVRDYGAAGDNATDDTAAIQAALDAAGVGGAVRLPPGVYRCGPLTTPNFVTIEGSTLEDGQGGTGVTELRFNALTVGQTGIILGANPSLRDLLIRGPGGAVAGVTGVAASSSPHFDRVVFANWATGLHLTGAYYTQIYETTFSRCYIGLRLTDCYNVNLYGPRFTCEYTTGSHGVAIDTGTVRALNIFGGAIEDFAVGVKVSGGGSGLNVFGTYWESSDDGANGIGIEASINGNNQITLLGGLVYLTNLYRWVNVGSQVGTTLKATGNKFLCSANSATNPTAYVVAGASLDVELSGDNWSNVAAAGASYVGGALNLGARVGFNITRPVGAGSDNWQHLGRGLWFPEGRDIAFGTATGTKIGTSTAQLLGFYGATPVARPAAVPVTAEGLHAALVQLGLIS